MYHQCCIRKLAFSNLQALPIPHIFFQLQCHLGMVCRIGFVSLCLPLWKAAATLLISPSSFFFGLCMSCLFLSVSFSLACTLDRCTVFYHPRFSFFFLSLPSFGALSAWALHRLWPPRLLAIDLVCMYALRISRLVNTCKYARADRRCRCCQSRCHGVDLQPFLTGAGLFECSVIC